MRPLLLPREILQMKKSSGIIAAMKVKILTISGCGFWLGFFDDC
jgi:hypothetical protein